MQNMQLPFSTCLAVNQSTDHSYSKGPESACTDPEPSWVQSAEADTEPGPSSVQSSNAEPGPSSVQSSDTVAEPGPSNVQSSDTVAEPGPSSVQSSCSEELAGDNKRMAKIFSSRLT
ncbi:hypothetical protein CesoFtcFv8_019469 [Champsocephalus esox]|uniref:Uncharacterized protein n=1 Tax=Champsocephalus esox TaxID=159716 RepID=A0AAN8GM86_9TELE|nr:hypothetical protein CesoFtcFv8_019469 [Champsocephalus esox]